MRIMRTTKFNFLELMCLLLKYQIIDEINFFNAKNELNTIDKLFKVSI